MGRKEERHRERLFPGRSFSRPTSDPLGDHVEGLKIRLQSRGRGQYLQSCSEIKTDEVADLIVQIPQIMTDARQLAEAYAEWDGTLNLEGALRASTLRYLAPLIFEEPNRMTLVTRLLEAALCLIDWAVVAKRVEEAGKR